MEVLLVGSGRQTDSQGWQSRVLAWGNWGTVACGVIEVRGRLQVLIGAALGGS